MPFTLSFTVWGLVAFVALFFAVGTFVAIRAMVAAHGERVRVDGRSSRDLTWRERLSRYEGPVTPDLARLNAPLRVGIEFVCALFGFPGFGWVMSTRVVVGVVLMLVGPAFAWCFYPVYLSVSGRLADNVYGLVEYLPVLAAISAGALAVVEARSAARRRAAKDR